MNSDEIKGKFEKAKGDVKERISGARKDRAGQAEGMGEQIKGKVREGAGKLESEMDREKGRREVKEGEE